jgi:hypothetical protein
LIGVIDKPVENGISRGGVADSLMPVRDRQLTGDDSGAEVIAVFKYFQQIMSALVIEWLKTPVIDDEELGSGQGGGRLKMSSTFPSNVVSTFPRSTVRIFPTLVVKRFPKFGWNDLNLLLIINVN